MEESKTKLESEFREKYEIQLFKALTEKQQIENNFK